MADVLKKFEFKKKVGVPGRYPWKEWMDGRVYRIKRGTDFHSNPADFRSYMYGRARSRGKKLRCHIDGDTMTFQFYDREAE